MSILMARMAMAIGEDPTDQQLFAEFKNLVRIHLKQILSSTGSRQSSPSRCSSPWHASGSVVWAQARDRRRRCSVTHIPLRCCDSTIARSSA
jgi:hypothetical protein